MSKYTRQAAENIYKQWGFKDPAVIVEGAIDQIEQEVLKACAAARARALHECLAQCQAVRRSFKGSIFMNNSHERWFEAIERVEAQINRKLSEV